MTKRISVGYIYFGVVVLTLLMRVASYLDIYGALGVTDSDAFFTCVVQILFFGAAPLITYFVIHRKQGLRAEILDFGVKKVSFKNCMLTLALAISMIIVGGGVSYAWQFLLVLVGFTHTSSPTDYSSVAVLFKQLALVAVLPALFEEITHRGLIYAGYKECGYKFVLVSALLFSLMHQNIVQTGYTFVDGVAMALVMYYTGSVFPAMFMHFLNNAYSVVSGYAAQNGGALNFINVISDWLTSPAGLGVAIAAFFIFSAVAAAILYAMRKDAVKHDRISAVPFQRTEAKPLYKDAPFLITVAMGVAATLFSFVWGMTR